MSCRIYSSGDVRAGGHIELAEDVAHVGILVNELNGLPQAQPALREDLVQNFAEHPLIGPVGVLGSIGSLGLITAAIAAGIALYLEVHPGLSRGVPVG